MPNLVTVEFRGDTLFAVEELGGVSVAVKPICDRLGLAWNKQLERIKRDPLLREGMTMTVLPSPGGPQETVCLALRLVNGWLFGVDVARVKPELREDVLAYKRECYEMLADRFLGPRAAERPILAPAPEAIEERNLRAEEHKLAMVREMRIIGGPARAYALWRKLGLADAEPESEDYEAARTRGRPGRVGPAFDPEAAIAAVRTFIQENRDTRFVPVRQAGADRTWARRNLAGFVGTRGDFLFLDAGWREATAGLDPHAVADALAEAGHLLKDASGKRKRAEWVGARTVRVYRVAVTLTGE